MNALATNGNSNANGSPLAGVSGNLFNSTANSGQNNSAQMGGRRRRGRKATRKGRKATRKGRKATRKGRKSRKNRATRK